MSLKEYVKKRNFTRTAEPKGKPHKAHAKWLEFVVQKHHASHLHYDFRLEMDGVLKSWAVPKGPSMNPKDKRLAVQVEDHPYEYRKFEGKIAEGNYGAGDVIVWDRGRYESAHDTPDDEKELLAGLKKGSIPFVLHGEKLKGEFKLVRRGDSDKEWLLVKKRDDYASTKDITEAVQSVKTGKTLPEDAGVSFKTGTKASQHAKVKPMLATLVDEPFDDTNWIYEIKWDGYRAIAVWDGKAAELYSRAGNDFSKKYPAVYEALHSLKHKVVLDGEIVVLDKGGKSQFSWLQNYGRDPKGTLIYYAFDILWCDGYDVRKLPLTDRKEILKQVVAGQSLISYSDHIAGKGKEFFAAAKAQGLEGIMAKKATSTYKEGVRSDNWLKIKTKLRQEVVIGGFTEPKGQRKHIGALLVGIYDGKEFKYVGHVGGGIPPKQLAPLREQLLSMEQPDSPFSQKVHPNNEVHWVKPRLLCEVTFAEWTPDGLMRQPIFVGLRTDKPAQQVHKEEAMSTKDVKDNKDYPFKFSHLDKIFWPEAGYTKGDLINYYASVMDYILPYIINRPQSMLRHPNGYNGKSFFQKDVSDTAPDWAKTQAYFSESNNKTMQYLVCDGPAALMYMVQMGCIEINPWSSRVGKLEYPDWVVLDLDPEDVPFEKVIAVAQTVKQVCDELNIPSYPKTSGKTGIHIFIPAGAKYTYDQLKVFAELLATLVHERHKGITSLERSPSKRPKKIYIDYLQNRETQTLAAPYSVRPTKAASVSTPLHWDEVKKGLKPEDFTVQNMSKRLKAVGDIWKPVLGEGIDLSKIVT